MTTMKTTITLRLFVAAALFALAFGCNQAPDTGAEYRDEANDTALLTPQERADRREALSRKWQEARDRLQELREKTNADGIQNEWDEAAAKVDREAADLRRQLDEFEEDSREAWNDFEARVERSLEAMGQEIDEALAAFS